MLAQEQARLHPLPATPFTAVFGVTRTVADNTPMVNFEHCQYSVPHRLVGETVWVRRHGEQIVIVHDGIDVASIAECFVFGGRERKMTIYLYGA